jgi:hypothetical protein
VTGYGLMQSTAYWPLATMQLTAIALSPYISVQGLSSTVPATLVAATFAMHIYGSMHVRTSPTIAYYGLRL